LNTVLSEALALLIALVFAGAAIAKLTAWRELPGVVQNFRVLPRALVLPVSLLLPLLEAAIAPGMVIKETRSVAALTAAVLFTIFGAALAMNYFRGRRHIDCGCFRSDLKQPISIAVIARNGFLAVCALLLPAGGTAALSPLAWAIAVAGGVTLFLCYLSVGLLFQGPAPSYEDNFHAARGISNRNAS
jgi:methylamine utilization protein MauE